jgi:hypothetical protein
MSNAVSTIQAIKKVYLNTAADLVTLLLLLHEQLAEEGVPSDADTTQKIDELVAQLKVDIAENNERCLLVAQLQNKIDPPSYVKPRKVVPYLTLVK